MSSLDSGNSSPLQHRSNHEGRDSTSLDLSVHTLNNNGHQQRQTHAELTLAERAEVVHLRDRLGRIGTQLADRDYYICKLESRLAERGIPLPTGFQPMDHYSVDGNTQRIEAGLRNSNISNRAPESARVNEQALQALRTENEKLQTEVSSLRNSLDSIEDLQQKLERQGVTLENKEQENSRLQEELLQLQEQLSATEQLNTKIVELEKKLEAQQNEKLQRQLEAGEKAPDATSYVLIEQLQAEIGILKGNNRGIKSMYHESQEAVRRLTERVAELESQQGEQTRDSDTLLTKLRKENVNLRQENQGLKRAMQANKGNSALQKQIETAAVTGALAQLDDPKQVLELLEKHAQLKKEVEQLTIVKGSLTEEIEELQLEIEGS